MFYRLYILVDGANFIFSKSKRPANDSIRAALLSDTTSKAIKDSIYLKLVEKILSQNLPDSALTTDELLLLRRYRNSGQEIIPNNTNPKIDAIIKTKPAVPQYHIVANKDGLVRISLSDFGNKKYSIKFYEDDDTFLFELKDIKESSLMLEKSNFYHSGWFKSELYETDKLIEKNRFFIPKDF
jgi:hypothetical protein